MLGTIKTLSLLQYKSNWQAARAQQLNSNIANAETPNYQRQDLKDFTTVLKAHAPHLRQISHMGTPPLIFNGADTVKSSEEVVREKEVMQLTENTADHQATLQLLKKCLMMLRTVAGK